jgi:hypothetical protein
MRQSELKHKVELFVTNGKLEEAQDVLAKIGYGPAQLDDLAAKLRTWNEYHHNAKTLDREKRKAAKAEVEARAASGAVATRFKRTGRRVFKGNIPVLTELGLYPPLWRRTGNGTTNDQTEPDQTNESRRRRSGPSKSTAAVLDRRRLLFGKGQDLTEEDQARLAERGWPVEEIREGAALIEAHAQADIIHTQKEQAHAAAVSAASAAAAELKKLYLEARGYAKDAIAELPPKKRARLEKLLGLND